MKWVKIPDEIIDEPLTDDELGAVIRIMILINRKGEMPNEVLRKRYVSTRKFKRIEERLGKFASFSLETFQNYSEKKLKNSERISKFRHETKKCNALHTPLRNAYVSSLDVDIDKEGDKEINNKDIINKKNNNKKRVDIVEVEKKINYSEFVMLKPSQHKSLIKQFGDIDTEACISALDNYIPNGKSKYKCHYRAILSWVIKRVEEEKSVLKSDKSLGYRDKQSLGILEDIRKEESRNG